MADYTTYVGGDPIKRAGGANAASFPMFTVWENTFDSSRRNMAATDTCSEFLTIPANTQVLGVYIEVLTAEASVTVSVGDTADADGYVAAQTAAATGVFKGAGALAAGKFYTAEDDLQFTIGGAPATVVKFRVAVIGANIG